MKIKNFDCVKMKREGAKILYDKIKNMNEKELLEFWKKGTDELRQRQHLIIDNIKNDQCRI